MCEQLGRRVQAFSLEGRHVATRVLPGGGSFGGISADREHISDDGGGKLHNASENPAADTRMLELVWRGGMGPGARSGEPTLDVNAPRRPRTRKWGTVCPAFEIGVSHGLLRKTGFNMEMAHARNATPLHYAARHGHVAQQRQPRRQRRPQEQRAATAWWARRPPQREKGGRRGAHVRPERAQRRVEARTADAEEANAERG